MSRLCLVARVSFKQEELQRMQQSLNVAREAAEAESRLRLQVLPMVLPTADAMLTAHGSSQRTLGSVAGGEIHSRDAAPDGRAALVPRTGAAPPYNHLAGTTACIRMLAFSTCSQ